MSTPFGIDRSGASGAGGTSLISSFLNLADPGADRILFWDESSNGYEWLTVGTGLSITNTTLSATGLLVLAGAAGGQIANGGTAASETLTLRGTAHATVGDVKLNDLGGDVVVGGAATASKVKFMEPSGSGTNYSSFAAQAQASNIDYTLPAAVGAKGSVLYDTTGAGALSWMLPMFHGKCRFEYTSTSVCTLVPMDGNTLIINSKIETIPDAGVTLANTDLAANDTTYNVYAYMNGSTMTLEASATAHALQAGTGIRIKSGDATRSLVGMVRKTSSNFADTAVLRFVCTYFNRRQRSGDNTAANAFSTGQVWVAKVELLCWANESVFAWGESHHYSNAGADTSTHSVRQDAAAAAASSLVSYPVGQWGLGSIGYAFTPSTDGYHYYELGCVSASQPTTNGAQLLTVVFEG